MTATDASVGVPLTRAMLAAAVYNAAKLGALPGDDLLDMLGIREQHTARQSWAERTGCAA